MRQVSTRRWWAAATTWWARTCPGSERCWSGLAGRGKPVFRCWGSAAATSSWPRCTAPRWWRWKRGPGVPPWPWSAPPHGRDHWLFRDVALSAGFHFGNTEHVASPPAGARVLARRPTSPALALDYGGDWVSVQFHPEMTVEAFARSWGSEAAQRMRFYEESPTAPRLLRNFVQRVAARGPRPG